MLPLKVSITVGQAAQGAERLNREQDQDVECCVYCVWGPEFQDWVPGSHEEFRE